MKITESALRQYIRKLLIETIYVGQDGVAMTRDQFEKEKSKLMLMKYWEVRVKETLNSKFLSIPKKGMIEELINPLNWEYRQSRLLV